MSARNFFDQLAEDGVRVLEPNNAYTSRSDDVSVMLRTQSILLLGFPGNDRHFDRAFPTANLDDVVILAKALVYSSSLAIMMRGSRNDLVTISWLTTDDIVLTDGTTRMGASGGGALYSPIGARIWSDWVDLHASTATHRRSALLKPG